MNTLTTAAAVAIILAAATVIGLLVGLRIHRQLQRNRRLRMLVRAQGLITREEFMRRMEVDAHYLDAANYLTAGLTSAQPKRQPAAPPPPQPFTSQDEARLEPFERYLSGRDEQ